MERSDKLEGRAHEEADEMESDVEEMEARAGELDEDVDDLKTDWHRKQEDSSIPGAVPAEEEDAGGEVAGD